MRIQPYSKLGHVSLGISRDELELMLGVPFAKRTNRVGLEELDYGDSVYRFESSGLLSEVTIEAVHVEFGKIGVPFANLAEFIASNDPDSVEKHGFILSPGYGVVFDPEDRPWVTVLTERGFEAWAKL
ncbi:MAG: hypothetical protein ACQEV6_10020 [Pseudomonadota bacterium]